MDKHEMNTELVLSRIENKDHKKEAAEYKNIREAIDKVSTSTIRTDMTAIAHLSRFLEDKPFNKAIQDDFIAWEKQLSEDYEHSSATLFRQKIKHFYKFISNKEKYKKGRDFQKTIKYPETVAFLSTIREENELPIESILTEIQIKKLLDNCKDVREQVIIVSLLDGGLRVSEMRSLKIKNVGFDRQLGAFFILPKKRRRNNDKLKTGQRKVQLFLIPSSTLYIRDYLNHHKFKGNDDAPFIYSNAYTMKNKDMDSQKLTAEAVWQIVTRIAKDSGLKDIHPHILRHNSATFCAMKGFNEAMLRERFGWSRSSTMPSYYTHLASSDVSNHIKKVLGIKDEEKPEKSLLQPIICWNCGTENPVTHIHCSKCAAKLKIKEKDMTPTATELGVLLQQEMPTEELEKFIGNMVLKKLKEIKEQS